MANYTQDTIKRLIAERGTTANGASTGAGLDESYLRKLFERPDAVPKLDTLLKLANFFDVPVATLTEPSAGVAAGIGRQEQLDPRSQGLGGRQPNIIEGDVRQVQGVTPPGPMAMPADIPVMGTAAGSFVGAFKLENGVVDYVRRPPALSTARDIYAIFVEGESMVPEHKPGDLRFVNPHRPVMIGDSVIVQVRNGDHQPVEAYIGHLLKRQPDVIILGKLNPESHVRIKRDTVKAIHKVLTMNDLFGV